MDLVGIFHVVDTPSSGKHDFNHIYVVGLIESILIQFIFDSVNFGSQKGILIWGGVCFNSPKITFINFLFWHHIITSEL